MATSVIMSVQMMRAWHLRQEPQAKPSALSWPWLGTPTFDDEQEEVIVLPMVAGRFERAQGGLDCSDQAK